MIYLVMDTHWQNNMRFKYLLYVFITSVGCSGNCPDRSLISCQSGECISKDLLCDGSPDCLDGSDETAEICISRPCRSKLSSFLQLFELSGANFFGESRCDYGACINNVQLCNGFIDCADGSDETESRCKTNRKCGHQEFRCEYGACISSFLSCNGFPNCLDGSDEGSHCLQKICTKNRFRCLYGACIWKGKLCDGKIDCQDGSDETDEVCGHRPDVIIKGFPFVPHLQSKYSSSSDFISTTFANLVTEFNDQELELMINPNFPENSTGIDETETDINDVSDNIVNTTPTVIVNRNESTAETSITDINSMNGSPSIEIPFNASDLENNETHGINDIMNTSIPSDSEVNMNTSISSDAEVKNTNSTAPSLPNDMSNDGAQLLDSDVLDCPLGMRSCCPPHKNCDESVQDSTPNTNDSGARCSIEVGESIEVDILECGVKHSNASCGVQTVPRDTQILASCWGFPVMLLTCVQDGLWHYFDSEIESVSRICQFNHINSPICGRVPLPRRENSLSISTATATYNHPWIVGIIMEGSYVCTGTLISPRWVMTSAHCFERDSQNITSIAVQHYDSSGKTLSLSEISSVHFPQNGNIDHLATINNGIALIKLTNSLRLSENIIPVCVELSNVREGEQALAYSRPLDEPRHTWNFFTQTLHKNCSRIFQQACSISREVMVHKICGVQKANRNAVFESANGSPATINRHLDHLEKWTAVGVARPSEHDQICDQQITIYTAVVIFSRWIANCVNFDQCD